MFTPTRNSYLSVFFFSFLLLLSNSLFSQQSTTVYVDVVALDQPWMFNRLGTAQPTGMIFALKRDVVPIDIRKGLTPGNVKLRDGKRPRPLVLRANERDNLIINFTNLLTPLNPNAEFEAYSPLQNNYHNPLTQTSVNQIYPATRSAGLHIMGVEMESSILSDGSWVGDNKSSLVPPGGKITYSVICPKEGSYLLYSTAANVATAILNGAQIANGLFGCLAVQPPSSEWYRSQVTQEDLYAAITHYVPKDPEKKIIIKKSDITKDGNDPPGFPCINYGATFKNGDPILRMYKDTLNKSARVLIYSDLTAIITGPADNSRDRNTPNFQWPERLKNNPVFDTVWVQPERRLPFREFAIHYHEATLAVQAFPIFYESDSPNVVELLKGGPDNFAINYGTGGIGAEIYANRIEVGPMAECVDCAYEEFFLSAWAVGDPAMVVDVPANASGKSEEAVNLTLNNDLVYFQLKDSAKTLPLPTVPKATKVLYPDDPSNVYNSYMSDHLKFRLNHGGAGITHVHHQHQHQWLHSPNNDEGHYLDSQTLNPGTSYTLEMVHNGSGNLNKSVGDQIFHCHFYPHFAQGMWSMWRVHDVLELGTVLDENGIAVPGARALPDGEIKTGTPIPGLVPLPSIPMAPLPGKISIEDGQVVVADTLTNPGFPFFIPGIAGKRPPHPPMDFAQGTRFGTNGKPVSFGDLDGGLPRGVIADGTVLFENHTQYDWTKIIGNLTYIELPSDGTPVEKVAMRAHATLKHPTRIPDNCLPGNFLLNGRQPSRGAPFADPYVNTASVMKRSDFPKDSTVRVYKAADVQIDAVFNKSGWHYPQQRVIALLEDVESTVDGTRPPEPFFFRANSYDIIEFQQTNLVPDYYELDDFQPRTPTDIIGQHIHLVKFDVTSSDGAANGFNYEDGTFATETVQERIEAINHMGGVLRYKYVKNQPLNKISNFPFGGKLTLLGPDPAWGSPPAGQDWNGAQTTIQRWYADPLYNNEMTDDRTLRTVFTHDHFGPSTHQQAGLYAGLLVEPRNTIWQDAVTGAVMGNRADGGPTSWQALIVYPGEDSKKSYREFALEFQDTQLGYFKDSKDTVTAYPHYYPGIKNGLTFRQLVDSTYRGWLDTDHVLNPAGNIELVSTGGQGTMSLNYRNEPLPLRAQLPSTNTDPGDIINQDMAFAFTSNTKWANDALNSQPGSSVLINPDSKNNTTHLISTNPDVVAYSFRYPATPLTPQVMPGDPYTPLLRAYQNDRVQVRTLVGAHLLPHFFNIHGVKWLFEPSAKNSGWRSTQVMSISEHFEMNFSIPTTPDSNNSITDYLYTASADKLGLEQGIWGIMRAYKSTTDSLAALPDNDPASPNIAVEPCGCPEGLTPKEFNVTALSVRSALSVRTLTYNKMYRNEDDMAMVYIPDDEVKEFKTNPDYVIEPLVLRANAGDCIKVTVTNEISRSAPIHTSEVIYGPETKEVGYAASYNVGLHAELLSYDVSKDDGTNVGLNEVQTIVPIKDLSDTNAVSRTYTWYAGRYEYNEGDNTWKAVDTEFGAVPLLPADPILQSFAGLFGALIIEPKVSFWKDEDQYKDAANIYKDPQFTELLFREHVLEFQDNLDIASLANTGNPDGGAPVQNAINYSSEPLGNRFLSDSGWNAKRPNFNSKDITGILSNTVAGHVPATPMPVAIKGTPFRFRVVHPGGGGNGEVFTLHGHNWQEEPYTDNSDILGDNPFSQTLGSRGQIGVWNNFDILLKSAGGVNGIPGSYLYRSFPNGDFQKGTWGLFVVTEGNDAVMAVGAKSSGSGNFEISGFVSLDPETNTQATTVSVTGSGKPAIPATTVEVNKNGTWTYNGPVGNGITVTSSNEGVLKLSKKEIDALAKVPEAPKAEIPHAQLLKIESQKRVLTEIGVKNRN